MGGAEDIHHMSIARCCQHFKFEGGICGCSKDSVGIINLAANPNGVTGDRMGLLTLCQPENHLELSNQDLRVFGKVSWG